MPTAACRPFSELIDTSEPPSRSFWPAYLATMNEPFRQTSTTERNSSTARSVISPRLPKPAQFTTTSSAPISSNRRCTEASSVTSTSAAVCGSPSSAARGPRAVAVAVRDRHPASVGGQGARGRPADPGCAADDDGDPLATVAHPVGLSTAMERVLTSHSRAESAIAAQWQTRLVTELKMSESISVAVTPDELYALVSDVTRMGEWSPICRACWWDEGAGPQVGAWFTGRNETAERTWETRCSGGGRRSRPEVRVGGQQRLGVLGVHLRARERRHPAHRVVGVPAGRHRRVP